MYVWLKFFCKICSDGWELSCDEYTKVDWNEDSEDEDRETQ